MEKEFSWAHCKWLRTAKPGKGAEGTREGEEVRYFCSDKTYETGPGRPCLRWHCENPNREMV